jgi:hypothetical protein
MHIIDKLCNNIDFILQISGFLYLCLHYVKKNLGK